jgi:Ras-related protein Rab-32
MNGENIEQEKMLKVIVVGDIGVGKTCLIKKYIHNVFSPHYKSTIGVDFGLKVMRWSDELVLKIQLWDIAGQERFQNMTRSYYKEAVGAFIVFDVDRVGATFDNTKKWKLDIDQKVTFMETEDPIPVILIANKTDKLNLDDENVKKDWDDLKEIMDKVVEEHGFIGWVGTSAARGTGIDEATRQLMGEILKREEELTGEEEQTPSIIDDKTLRGINNPENKGCCS